MVQLVSDLPAGGPLSGSVKGFSTSTPPVLESPLDSELPPEPVSLAPEVVLSLLLESPPLASLPFASLSFAALPPEPPLFEVSPPPLPPLPSAALESVASALLEASSDLSLHAPSDKASTAARLVCESAPSIPLILFIVTVSTLAHHASREVSVPSLRTW